MISHKVSTGTCKSYRNLCKQKLTIVIFVVAKPITLLLPVTCITTDTCTVGKCTLRKKTRKKYLVPKKHIRLYYRQFL